MILYSYVKYRLQKLHRLQATQNCAMSLIMIYPVTFSNEPGKALQIMAK